MENIDLANAIIAAALIQSGQFKLSDFDDRGQPISGRLTGEWSDAQRLMLQAELLGNPEFDSFGSPALTTLRKLANATGEPCTRRQDGRRCHEQIPGVRNG